MKYLLAGMFALAMSFSSVAQSKFAVQAGYNHNTARVHVSNVKQPTGYVPGFNIGARFKTSFEPPLHFVGMLSYNMRGYTLKPLQGDTSKIETHIHYIDIAPLLSFDIGGSDKNHFSITAGPVMGIAFSGRQKTTENGVTTSAPMKFDVSKDYGYASFAIFTGLSYHFDKMFVEASYHLGVSSINNNEETDNTNIKNRGFAISLGYWLK